MLPSFPIGFGKVIEENGNKKNSKKIVGKSALDLVQPVPLFQ